MKEFNFLPELCTERFSIELTKGNLTFVVYCINTDFSLGQSNNFANWKLYEKVFPLIFEYKSEKTFWKPARII